MEWANSRFSLFFFFLFCCNFGQKYLFSHKMLHYVHQLVAHCVECNMVPFMGLLFIVPFWWKHWPAELKWGWWKRWVNQNSTIAGYILNWHGSSGPRTGMLYSRWSTSTEHQWSERSPQTQAEAEVMPYGRRHRRICCCTRLQSSFIHIVSSLHCE